VRRPVIAAADLPPYITELPQTSESQSLPIDLDEAAAAFERRLIVEALNQADGVQVRAAELLGITERSLWHRLKKYDITVSKTVASQA